MNDAPIEAPHRKLPRGLAPLGYRDFALYWVGIATTTAGRWVELTGLLWIVYELTDSPFLVGLLGAARAFPNLILSPVAGVIADRLNQRAILYVTQSAGLVASLSLGILIASGLVELWQIYLQVLIQAAITAFDAAARQALFPRLIPRQMVSKAVTLTATAGRMSKFVGPALGGLLIAGWGVSAPFFVNAASFLGLMAALAWLRLADGRVLATKASSFRGELMEGLRHLLSEPVLRGLFTLEIVLGIFQINPALIAIMGRELLDVGPRSLGFLLSAPAFGSFVGIAWLLISERTTRHGRFSLCCTLTYSAAMAFIAFSWSYSLMFAGLAVVGMLDVVVSVTRNSILQLAAPEHMRGRVMGNMGQVTRGIGPFAETQSGTLANLIGPHLATLAAAAAVGIAAGLTARFNKAVWDFSL